MGINNGRASIGSNSVAITTGAWHNFQANVDFIAGTETAYVDGALIGSIPFFAPGSTELTDVQTGINNSNGAGTSQAYLDNLTIESVGVLSPVTFRSLARSFCWSPVLPGSRLSAAGKNAGIYAVFGSSITPETRHISDPSHFETKTPGGEACAAAAPGRFTDLQYLC